MHLKNPWLALSLCLCLIPANAPAQSAKPIITLDEYLNTTDISEARLSPDGSSAVIATDAPDWKNSVYRHDLWIWNAQSGLRSLTHSAGEEEPKWSPNGKWIASAGEDNTVRVWSAEDGTLLQTLQESQQPLLDVAFSPDSRFIAASSDKQVLTWQQQ